MLALGQQFGASKVLMLQNKNQALMELPTIEAAKMLVSSTPQFIRSASEEEKEEEEGGGGGGGKRRRRRKRVLKSV